MQQRAQNTRKAILNAAVKLFAERGYSGAPVDDIAAEAGVNKQRIYFYFGSKKQLFEAALQNVFAEAEMCSLQTIEEIKNDMEHMTGILLNGFFRVHEKNPIFWRMLAWANLEPEISIDCLNEVRTRENADLRFLFDQNLSSGVIRKVEFVNYLFMLLSAAYFYHSNRLTLSHTIGGGLFEEKSRKKLIDEMDRLFRGK